MALAVDLNSAQFSWTWNQGTGGTATSFEIGLGTVAGIYTALTPVAITLRNFPAKSVTATPGTYFAAIRAKGASLPSPWSNEVTFQGDFAPAAPTAFVVA